MTEVPQKQAFGDYAQWPGRDVLDPDGEALGAVVEIYLDDATDLPEWVLVRLADGDDQRFVPLADATVEERAIRVAMPADRVESAPAIDQRVELTQNQERELYDHYGLRYSEEESDSGLPAAEPARDEEKTQAAPRRFAPSAPSDRPRLRRYAAPEPPATVPAPIAAPEPPAPAPEPIAASPPPAPKPSAPEPFAAPEPPPEPAGPLAVLRKRGIPPAAAAGAAAGVLTLVLVLLRRRR